MLMFQASLDGSVAESNYEVDNDQLDLDRSKRSGRG